MDPRIISELTPLLVFVVGLIVAGWVVWVDSKRRQAKNKQQTEVRTQILEKFGSSDEFINFLKTEEGQRYFETASRVSARPADKILRSIQVGVIFALVGVSSLLIGWFFEGDGKPPIFIGALALAVGLGFLISASISYRLLKTWGLLKETVPTASSESASELKTSN
jgi:hypothetical protein